MKYSLRSLFVVVTLAGFASYLGYLVTRPYYVTHCVDCGKGRWIEILRPNGFCDQGGPVHFRFSGMHSPESPPTFSIWGCGECPQVVLVAAEKGDLVAIARSTSSDEIFIMVDFQTGAYWPDSAEHKVNDLARNMLVRLRKERGKLWLKNTYDHELTKTDDRKE